MDALPDERTGLQFLLQSVSVAGGSGAITTLCCLIWDCVPFLSPLNDSQDYGGGILARLQTGTGIDLNYFKNSVPTSQETPRLHNKLIG
jgi:hypothetical protein